MAYVMLNEEKSRVGVGQIKRKDKKRVGKLVSYSLSSQDHLLICNGKSMSDHFLHWQFYDEIVSWTVLCTPPVGLEYIGFGIQHEITCRCSYELCYGCTTAGATNLGSEKCCPTKWTSDDSTWPTTKGCFAGRFSRIVNQATTECR